MNKFWIVLPSQADDQHKSRWNEADARGLAQHLASKSPGQSYTVFEALAVYSAQVPLICEELEKEKPF